MYVYINCGVLMIEVNENKKTINYLYVHFIHIYLYAKSIVIFFVSQKLYL